MDTKAKIVNVRLAGDDLRIFESLCRQDVRSSSAMLRYLILQEYNRRLNMHRAVEAVAEISEVTK